MSRVVAVWLAIAAVTMYSYGYQALAREYTKQEHAELQRVLQSFENIFSSADYSRFADFMPPKLWSYIRDKTGLTDQQLRDSMAKVFAEAFQEVELDEFHFDASSATKHELSNGSSYLLLPTTTKVRMPGSGYAVFESQTLAFMEGGKWCLVRISDLQQQMLLKAAYPEFGTIEFPPEKTNFFKE